uniref:hypothetical protein n=1 Tax=Halorubrum salsamenti TaxID=2583990 RepID=UPI0016427907
MRFARHRGLRILGHERDDLRGRRVGQLRARQDRQPGHRVHGGRSGVRRERRLRRDRRRDGSQRGVR